MTRSHARQLRRARTFTRAEAADELAISLRSIDRLLADGSLPRVRLGRRVVLLDQDLDALLVQKRERAARSGVASPENGDVSTAPHHK